MNQLNMDKVKEVSFASHTAEIAITALAMRERHRNSTNITKMKRDLVKNNEKIVDEDFLSFWKGFSEAGVGVIKYGRKGGPDRFKWNYSLKTIAQVALEGRAIEPKKLENTVVTGLVRSKSFSKKQALPKNVVLFPIRGETVKIKLPQDVTKEEVRGLARMLRKSL